MPTFEQFLFAEEIRTSLLDSLRGRRARRQETDTLLIQFSVVILLYLGIVVSCFV